MEDAVEGRCEMEEVAVVDGRWRGEKRSVRMQKLLGEKIGSAAAVEEASGLAGTGAAAAWRPGLG